MRNLGQYQHHGIGKINLGADQVRPMSMLTPQQQYITQKFMSQVYIQDQMDVQDEPIYDTVSFLTSQAMNQTTVSFFSNVGDGAPLYLTATVNKTLAQTNMTRNNTLIAPEAQAIFQYRLKFNENIDPRDLLSITGANVANAAAPGTTGFAFQFRMGTKEYQTGPIGNYAAGGGVYFTGTASDQSFLNNGMPCSNCAEALSVNLVIENEESFRGNFIGNAYTVLGTFGVSIVLQLMGLHARPIR